LRARERLHSKTVRGVLERLIKRTEDVEKALVVLSDLVGIDEVRLRECYGASELATRQTLAAVQFQATCGGDFQVALIPIDEIRRRLSPLLNHREGGDDDATSPRTIDLSFLGPLKEPEDETFLVPDTVYVRDSMRHIFGLFHEDSVQIPRRPPNLRYSAALLGSPGAGASILFFLTALHQATTQSVAYYRTSKAELVSVFVMSPEMDADNQRTVRIWFSRNVVPRRLNQGLTTVANDLSACRAVDRGACYTFVDGPDHGDIPNTLYGNYDYFCTSGGFPPYANEERKKRLWILDGWNEEEAVHYLAHVKPDPDTEQEERIRKARAAYWLCGGNIRDMLDASRMRSSLSAGWNSRSTNLTAVRFNWRRCPPSERARPPRTLTGSAPCFGCEIASKIQRSSCVVCRSWIRAAS
jgi:hypothetical protein